VVDNIEIPIPEPKDVTTVVEHPNEAIPHVIEHEGRITHIEEQQEQRYNSLMQRIEDTKSEIFTAMEHARTEQASALNERLRRLEETAMRIESTIVEAPQEVVDDISAAPTEAVQVVPEVQHIEQKIEPKGIRARRKAHHKG
jgi:hypothetical protein